LYDSTVSFLHTAFRHQVTRCQIALWEVYRILSFFDILASDICKKIKDYTFSLIFSEICFLSRCLVWKSSTAEIRFFIVFFSSKIPLFSSTSSGVAPSLNQITGTPISKASTVPIPKLSLVRFIIPLAFFTIFWVSSGESRPRKMMVSHAMDFR
jgi:hypothetical protein